MKVDSIRVSWSKNALVKTPKSERQPYALGDSRQVEMVAFFAERFEKVSSYVAQAEALILLTIEISRLHAAKLLYNNNLWSYSREFTTLKGRNRLGSLEIVLLRDFWKKAARMASPRNILKKAAELALKQISSSVK